MNYLLSIFLLPLSINATGADTHKPFYEALLKGFNGATAAVKLSDFKAREEVWLGECVSKFAIPEITYNRSEHYLPVIRHKTAPGEAVKIQFCAIDVGGDPYSSTRHIDDPDDAIWFLRGDAAGHISLADESKGTLEADYYDDGEIVLKRGKLNGTQSLFYTRTDKSGDIVKVCYFDEKVL